jgi:NhaP-type Na+/H+ or K+/H+ antiporter
MKLFGGSYSRKGNNSKGSSLAASLGSLTVAVLVLFTVVSWHGTTPKVQQKLQNEHEASVRRFLEQEAPPIDDDATRTQECKQYLYNFLNGTTDANDECQAFKNAYNAADCADDTHINILGEGNQKNDDSNSNSTDDDVMIDDFFENWECCDSIQSFYEKNCDSSSDLHSVRLLGIMLVLLVCSMIKALLKRMNVNWLPDACAFILVGTTVGGILRLFDSGLVQNKLSFDNDLFLQILLPPIIFEAALSIDKRAFRRDLFPILAFAGFGTAFSAIAIGLITHQVSKWGGGEDHYLPLLDSLVFGSLISSIDPVATLSILSGVGVSQTDTLYTLIFGESLLNDGVAIVLFDTLKSYLGEGSDVLDGAAYQQMAKHFLVVLSGSMGVGVGTGMCCTLYFWCLRGRQTAVTEVAIFFCWALIPYYIADGLGCSGIISIMVMGFFMDYYVIGGFQSEDVAWTDYMAMRSDENGVAVEQQHGDRWSQMKVSFGKAFSGRGHILSRSRHHVGFVAEVIASVMETAIFAYLGLFLFNDNVWNLRLNLTAILSCVSSRAVMVVGLGFLINVAVFLDFENQIAKCFRSCNRRINVVEDDDSAESRSARVYLDRKTQLILLLAGVRGAVSFALVENIPVWDAVTKTGSQYKAELKAMTSSSIVFTLFVFGALTYITVKQGTDSSDRHIAGNLTHRLLSEPLDSNPNSDSDENTQSEMNSLSLEIDVPDPARRLPPREAYNPAERYQLANEWSE